YDSINEVVLAMVKVDKSGGEEGDEDNRRNEVQTWAYDAGANRWTRMKPAVEPDAGGNRTRNLVFAPELNLVILENCTSRPREQQVWTYRYADAKPTAAGAEKSSQVDAAVNATTVVTDVVVSVLAKNRVEISWTRPALAQPVPPNAEPVPPNAEPVPPDAQPVPPEAEPVPLEAKDRRYVVERAVVEVYSDDQLVRLKQNTPPLSETSVGAIHRVGRFVQLTAEPIQGTSFVDDAIDLSQPQKIDGEPTYDRQLHAEHVARDGRAYPLAVYAYRVRMLDDAGKPGGPSPATLTIPASPQQVFAKEDGETCQLKWAANAEKGIAGYRVYRLDGRWDKDSVSRLTAEPIEEMRFADETAGKSTRRYYVVAVDALGQEGFPSSPVWYRREWREYYGPFVGEWHQ
ncbi:MAG: hypothetical protein WD875_06335, partial [Pirellulales bacterium]